MLKPLLLAAVAASTALGACASPLQFQPDQVVDLSHDFDQQTIYWPTEEGFVLEQEANGITAKGYFYAANKFRCAEHGGTHIDAPLHFHGGGRPVNEILVTQLIGAAVLIDVSLPCATDADHQITSGELRAWEQQYGRIPDGAIVLLRTGYARLWPDRVRYLGTDERGEAAVAKLHFPGLAPEAAQWLVDNRSIRAIGIDTASIDPGQSKLFESHQTLFAHDIPAFENLTRLDELPATSFHVIALPMKIRGGSGAPLRIIAVRR
jgi:kynurenine formamidase